LQLMHVRRVFTVDLQTCPFPLQMSQALSI